MAMTMKEIQDKATSLHSLGMKLLDDLEQGNDKVLEWIEDIIALLDKGEVYTLSSQLQDRLDYIGSIEDEDYSEQE